MASKLVTLNVNRSNDQQRRRRVERKKEWTRLPPITGSSDSAADEASLEDECVGSDTNSSSNAAKSTDRTGSAYLEQELELDGNSLRLFSDILQEAVENGRKNERDDQRILSLQLIKEGMLSDPSGSFSPRRRNGILSREPKRQMVSQGHSYSSGYASSEATMADKVAIVTKDTKERDQSQVLSNVSSRSKRDDKARTKLNSIASEEVTTTTKKKKKPSFKVNSRTMAKPAGSKEPRLRASARMRKEKRAKNDVVLVNKDDDNTDQPTNKEFHNNNNNNNISTNESNNKKNTKNKGNNESKKKKGNNSGSNKVTNPIKSDNSKRRKSNSTTFGSSSEDRESRLKMEKINRERHRWISRWSKYGTWRDLQKLYEEKRKKRPQPIQDQLHDDLHRSLDGDEKTTSIVEDRIRRDVYLLSLCREAREYAAVVAKVVKAFGTAIKLSSRTQILSYYTLSRLHFTTDNEVVRSLAQLCFHAFMHNYSGVTATLDHDRRQQVTHYVFTTSSLASHSSVRISHSALEKSCVGIVRRQFANSTAEVHFPKQSLFMLFMAAMHLFVAYSESQAALYLTEKMEKKQLVAILPLLCGLTAPDDPVERVRRLLGLNSASRNVHIYFSPLSAVWLDSQHCFLQCVHEAKLRDAKMSLPHGDNRILLTQADCDQSVGAHHVIALAHYLQHGKTLDGLHISQCLLDDDHLLLLPKSLGSRVRSLELRGNFFGMKGLAHIFSATSGMLLRSLDLSDCDLDDEALAKLASLVSHLEELVLADNFFTWYGIRKLVQTKSHWRLRRLDMSRCHLNEHAFFELVTLIVRTNEVVLNGNVVSPIQIKFLARHLRDKNHSGNNSGDNSKNKNNSSSNKNESSSKVNSNNPSNNTSTRNSSDSVSKVSGSPSRRTPVSPSRTLSPLRTSSPKKTLSKMSSPKKSHLNALSKQESLSNGEAAISSRARRLERLYLESCEMDDSCLFEMLKVVPHLNHLSVRANRFSVEAISALARCCRKNDNGRLRSLNMRDCHLNEDALTALIDVIVRLETINVSNNNFNSNNNASNKTSGIRLLIEALRAAHQSEQLRVRKIEMRQCRLNDANKRALADLCKPLRIDLKLW